MQYLSEFSTFSDKQELNHNVTQHEQAYADELTATHRKVLRYIARYAVKYAGAAHLKIATIAEGVGVSYKTVSRAINHLESLEIVKRINRTRPKTGGKGASIIQVLPYMSDRLTDGEVDEKADATGDEQAFSENEPLRNLDKPNARTRDGEDTDKRGLKSTIPTAFYDALSPFFDAKGLYEVYGVLLRAKAKADRSVTLEDNAQAYIDVFYNVIRKHKLGQVRNMFGLLYASWQKVTGELSRMIALNKGDLFDEFEAVMTA